MQLHEMWVGGLTKVGATLAVIGAETIQGTIVRADSISHASAYFYCKALGIRMGLGLGASAGVSAIFVFNTQLFGDLQGLDLGGPSITIAFTEKFGKIPLGKEEYEIYKMLGKGINLANDANKANMLTNRMNTMMSLVTAGSGPTGLVIDIPYAGIGLELSAVWAFHYKLELGNN
jgi:hypothetical protein